MPEFIFPTHNIRPEQLIDERGQPLKFANTCRVFAANTPYCLSDGTRGQGIPNTLSGLMPKERENLMCSMDIFDQRLLQVADLYDRAISTLNLQAVGSLVGAGATASHARLSGFQKAIVDYQKTLIALSEYGQKKQHGRPAAAKKSQLKAAAQKAYQHLQNTYKTELKKIVTPAEWGKNRGSALSSAERGITVATRRKYRHLHIQNNKQAVQLAKLTKGINYAGNGLIVLDAGIRANQVRNVRQSKGDWQRELAVQTTGFGFGGAAGLWAGTSTAGFLTAIGLGLTPLGWVVLVGAAMTVGYLAATEAEKHATAVAGYLYDSNYLGRIK